ncbi:flagellar FlbD family protein [Paraliobacillus sp. JSM ZJ581]|uniref:flagellar FlbD family protein n=1 Tax=Paraliobacillus sp. JSM ZJ581 TaxID=3342118 RepID=UPI0035A9603E
MIEITKFTGETFTLNALYIEQIQSFPDTTITLINGKKLVVRETHSEVIEAVDQYYQKIGIQGFQKEVSEKDES